MSTEQQYQSVIKTLEENGKWMTVDQIIRYANSQGWTETKRAPRQAQAHPFWKIISNLTIPEYKDTFNKRITRLKSQKGVYEYSIDGLTDGTTIIINGRRLKRVVRNNNI